MYPKEKFLVTMKRSQAHVEDSRLEALNWLCFHLNCASTLVVLLLTSASDLIVLPR